MTKAATAEALAEAAGAEPTVRVTDDGVEVTVRAKGAMYVSTGADVETVVAQLLAHMGA